MKIFSLCMWIGTIIAGALLAQIVPESYIYITGFCAGTISYVWLRLFKDI